MSDEQTSGDEPVERDSSAPAGSGDTSGDSADNRTGDSADSRTGDSTDGSTSGPAGSSSATGGGTPGVRRERFDSPGPAELEISVGSGRVRIDLVETTDPASGAVTVEVSADRAAAQPWSRGLGGLLDWIGSSMSGAPTGADSGDDQPPRGFEPIVGASWERSGDPAQAAVDATTVDWSDAGRRLVVRAPEDPTLGAVPLHVTVSAPAGSRPAVRTGAAPVELTGRSGWTAIRTGSGAARLPEVDGDVDVTTGSGGIDLGACTGRATLRAGTGAVEAGSLAGSSRIRTGSGDIRVGELAADLEVRTGSGDVVIADAVSGDVRVSTGSGGVRVGVHSGVAAELDLSTGSGRARSELDVRGDTPQTAPALKLSGRTGSGDVLVGRAAATAA
ncbi:DUF4097 family beta strand repeat-containing protein [Pseudonocardia phyllosphaerae]|uniref:DUF4097 family beta strand repeat-containing protein n=1 Tax=Pseudonocardia phyllosphaerae TaxID=3390502 RepID=UPI00397ADE03